MCKKCGNKGCGCNFKQPKRFDDIPDLTRSTQFYSQVYDIAEPSGNWKFDLGAVNDFVGLRVNNVDLGYIPMLTGNVSNLNEYVTDSAGDQWIIDVLGNAKKLAGGGGSGTVTNITAGSGMDFTTISASGAVTMGTPSSITLSSTNGFPSSTTHTHELSFGGTSSQVVLGDKTLGTYTSGTVTSFAFTDGNGFDGTVINSGTAPTLSLTTNVVNQRIMWSSSGAIVGSAGLTWNGVGQLTIDGTGNPGFVVSVSGANGFSFYNGAGGVGNFGIYDNTAGLDRFVLKSTGVVQITNLAGSGTRMVVADASGNLSTSVNPTGQYVSLSIANGGFSSVETGINLSAQSKSTSLVTDVTSTNTPVAARGYLSTIGEATGYDFKIFSSASTQDSAWYKMQNAGTGTWYQIANRAWVTANFTNNTGTVTNFSANNLNAGTYNLFSVNVTNPTTIPDLTFSLPTLPQKLVFAAPWGTSGTPFWRQLQISDLQGNGAIGGQVITWNGVTNQWEPMTPTGTTYTGGTGISVAGSVITNTMPSKWTAFSTYIAPTASFNIRTQSSGSQGWAELSRGTASVPGSIVFVNPAQATVGYIGNSATYMEYYCVTGNHRFMNATVQLSTIPTSSTSVNILTSSGTGSGIIESRTIASLGIVANGDVWFDQTTGVAATNNTQHIARGGRVRIGATGSSAYTLSLIGNAGVSSDLDFTALSVGLRGLDSGGAVRYMIRQIAGSFVEIGNTTNDLTLPKYLNTRDDTPITPALNALFTSSTGGLRSMPIRIIQNDGGEVYITTSEPRTAGAGNTRVTFNTNRSSTNSLFSYDVTTGDVKIQFGIAGREVIAFYEIEYTTAGTPLVTCELRLNNGGTLFETAQSTGVIGTNRIKGAELISGVNATDYASINVGCTGSNITITKAKIILTPRG